MAYGFDDDKSKVEVYSKEEITISTSAPPATGTPNTIYIQIVN